MREAKRKNAVWMLVCVIGCAYQITMLTIYYMNYEISSNVRFTFERKLHLPAITWCVTLANLVDWDNPQIRKDCDVITGMDCGNMTTQQLIKYASELPLGPSGQMSQELFRLYDVPDLIKMTISDTDVIGYGARYSPSSLLSLSMGAPSDTFIIAESIVRTAKCFSMNWKKKIAIVPTYRLRRSTFEKREIFSRIFLTLSQPSTVLFYLGQTDGFWSHGFF